MDLNRNSFKHAIAAGKLQIGLWCSLCSNIAADRLDKNRVVTTRRKWSC